MKEKLVSVVWRDAVSGTYDWTNVTDVGCELEEVTTTGYQVNKNEGAVTVALSISDEECRNTITIPMACVTAIYSIEDPCGVADDEQ